MKVSWHSSHGVWYITCPHTSHIPTPPEGRGSFIKRTGMLVGSFEKNPYEVPRPYFVGAA